MAANKATHQSSILLTRVVWLFIGISIGYFIGGNAVERKYNEQIIANQREDGHVDQDCFEAMPRLDDPNYWDKLHRIC